MPAFKTEAEFQKWLAKTPTARARLQLATADGVKVEPLAATSAQADRLARVGTHLLAPATAEFAAPRRRWTLGGAHLRSRVERATGWFFLAMMGAGLLGAWTCLVALYVLALYTV